MDPHQTPRDAAEQPAARHSETADAEVPQSPAVQSPANDSLPTAASASPAGIPQSPAVKDWMGAFGAFSQAFSAISKNIKPLAVFAAIHLALAIYSYVTNPSDPLTVIRTIFGGAPTPIQSSPVFIPLIVSMLLLVPEFRMALALADNRAATIGEVLRFNPIHLVWIILATILVLPLIVIGGLLLLIPLIWIIPWFSMVAYAIIDRNDGPVKALSTSRKLTKSDIGKVWGVMGVTILISLAAAVTAIIPVLGETTMSLIGIISYAASAVLYRWLLANRPLEAKS